MLLAGLLQLWRFRALFGLKQLKHPLESSWRLCLNEPWWRHSRIL